MINFGGVHRPKPKGRLGRLLQPEQGGGWSEVSSVQGQVTLSPRGSAYNPTPRTPATSGTNAGLLQPGQGGVQPAVQQGQATLQPVGQPTAVPRTGLIGAEQAIGQGFDGAMGLYNQHFANAARALGGNPAVTGTGTSGGGFRSKYTQRANNQIGAGEQRMQNQQFADANRENMGQYIDQARGDVRTAAQGANEALTGARGDINAGYRDSQGYLNDAMGTYQPFAQQGGQAFNRLSALSGALGGDAQAAAYDQFTESPGQAFLREQAERAVLRNSAATGGLGGGRVLQELQRQGMGLAAQDFNNYYNRMAGVADIGVRANDAVANIQQNMASNASNRGAQLAGIQGQRSANQMQMGGLLAGLGESGAGNTTSLANANTAAAASRDNARTAASASNRNAQIAADTSLRQALANTYQNWGNNTAGMAYGTGNTLAGLRTDAGNNIATANLGTGQALGNAIYGAAGDAANIVGGGSNNIASILGGAGSANAQGWNTLANGMVGANGQLISGLGSTTGMANPAWNQGIIGNLGNFLGGVGSIMGV